MHPLTGTWRLTRLALRRDRIKLPIIIGVLAFVLMGSAAATVDLYGEPDQRLTYAATSAPSVVGRVFAGPIDGPDLGSIVLNETYLFTALAVAFMSTLTVIRHTRQNEETGRSELVGSGIVSHHASLAAALLVAVAANVLFAGVTALIFYANGLPLAGSLATGAAMGATGVTFAALAGIAAQLTDSARGANSLCALLIGVAFILRGIGDSTGKLVNGGLGVQSTFPSWISPFGWGQQVYPFTQQEFWIFALFGTLTVVAIVFSVALMARRDIGSGIFPTRLGRAHAKASLLSTFGLAARLQRGILRGWAIAIVVLGISYGLVIKEFENLLAENEQFQEALGDLGGSVNDAFLSILISFMAITITGYAVQALLRLRSEESSGQLESVLGTNVSRSKWMMSHVSFVIGGILLLLILTALSMGLTFVISTGASWSELWPVIGATLTQTAAIFAFCGFVIALFGLLPKLLVPIAWGGFAACLLILQMGVLLKLPQWVLNISPFGHLPALPAEPFELAPVVGLLLAGLALSLLGFGWFSRRDTAA